MSTADGYVVVAQVYHFSTGYVADGINFDDPTRCGLTDYMSAPATATTPMVCTALTNCTASEYEATAATAFADRTCSALTVCNSEQYESISATPTSDRSCEAFNGVFYRTI